MGSKRHPKEVLVRLGGDSLIVEDLPEPDLAPGEVVVDVAVTGIYASGLRAYRGCGRQKTATPVLRQAQRSACPATAAGSPSFHSLGARRTRECSAGSESPCPDRRLLGSSGPATFATQVAVQESAVLPVPETVGLGGRTAPDVVG